MNCTLKQALGNLAYDISHILMATHVCLFARVLSISKDSPDQILCFFSHFFPLLTSCLTKEHTV